jgi:kynurenine formamidase
MRDLTHRIEPGMPTYPGDPVVETWPDGTHENDGYRVSAFGMGTHTGTHVDAPNHVEPEGRTLDTYPIDRFEGEAVVASLDVGAEAAVGADSLRTALAEAPGREPDWLIVDTGWWTNWGTERYWDHPYLTPEAAALCVDRGVDVAIDTPGVDPMGGHLAAHDELFCAERLVVENLTALDGLGTRVRFGAYPLALTDADGAPVRAVAGSAAGGDPGDPTV